MNRKTSNTIEVRNIGRESADRRDRAAVSRSTVDDLFARMDRAMSDRGNDHSQTNANSDYAPRRFLRAAGFRIALP